MKFGVIWCLDADYFWEVVLVGLLEVKVIRCVFQYIADQVMECNTFLLHSQTFKHSNAFMGVALVAFAHFPAVHLFKYDVISYC